MQGQAWKMTILVFELLGRMRRNDSEAFRIYSDTHQWLEGYTSNVRFFKSYLGQQSTVLLTYYVLEKRRRVPTCSSTFFTAAELFLLECTRKKAADCYKQNNAYS